MNKPGPPPPELADVHLYGWLGLDELGSGKYGLKQAACPAGLIPIVAVDRIKAERFLRAMDLQAAQYGKKIRLCRFELVEVLYETANGEDV